MAQRTWRPKRVVWTAVAMLLGSANCAHSCGPDIWSNGGGGPPFKASCSNMAEGKSCPTLNDTTCEVRVFANQACNTIWKCDVVTEIWKSRPPLHTGCASECPPLSDGQAPDAPCAVPNAATLICDYPEETCGCAPVNGSADAAAVTFEWRCTKHAAGCPGRRPHVGSSCLGTQVCDYGDCSLPDGVRVRCAQDEWMLEDTCTP